MEEKLLHPIVVNYLKEEKKCLDAVKDTGHPFVGYADAFGIKDIGGMFRAEVIGYAVEVKTSTESFGKHIGQALGYSLFSHRCYFAVPEKFRPEHIEMANRLGVGLIEIDENNKRCKEILTAQHHEPIENLFLSVVETLGWDRCNFCGEFFQHSNEWTKKNISYAFENKKTYYHQIPKQDVYYTKRQRKRRYPIHLCQDCLKELYSLKS